MTIYSLLKQLTLKISILLTAMLTCLTACNHVAYSQDADQDLADKFRGSYGVLVSIDSLTHHQYVTITTETGRKIASPASLKLGGGGDT